LVHQALAGAQLLEVFDTWAGDLSPTIFEEFSLPYLKDIAHGVKSRLRKLGVDVPPMTIFPKGATYALPFLSSTEYDVVSIDWNIDPREARRLVGDRLCLQGNLDPSVLFGSDDAIKSRAQDMLERFGTHRYIANLGHGMLPSHTPAAVGVLVDTIHEHSEALVRRSGFMNNSILLACCALVVLRFVRQLLN